MRYQEVYEVLHKSPFEPFRIQLTNGQSLTVRHPDFAWVMRSGVLIGIPSEDDSVPDLFKQYDLLHVVGIEPVNGTRPNGRGKSRRKRK